MERFENSIVLTVGLWYRGTLNRLEGCCVTAIRRRERRRDVKILLRVKVGPEGWWWKEDGEERGGRVGAVIVNR